MFVWRAREVDEPEDIEHKHPGCFAAIEKKQKRGIWALKLSCTFSLEASNEGAGEPSGRRRRRYAIAELGNIGGREIEGMGLDTWASN